MGGAIGLVFLFWIAVAASWVGNLVKLTECDFDAPVKCEIVHGVGLIPIASIFTIWFDTDKVDDNESK